MRIYIEDIVDELDCSGESFMNAETGAIVTMHDDLECAAHRFDTLDFES